MCHPWLAAGVVAFAAVIVVRELGAIVREPLSEASLVESGLLGDRPRRWFRKRMRPLVEVALDSGLTADGATLLQLATSVTCGIAYAHGWMFTAGWMLITCGTLDVLDGEMARRLERDGPRGAFMDSVVDRYGETAVFAGLVAFFRSGWIEWAVLAAWAGSFMVSYTRARAESLDVPCPGGLLQRPERYVILGGISMISTVVQHLACYTDIQQELMAAGISVLALLANVTALQRLRGTLQRFS